MNCIEIQELLSPYYDGELSVDARTSVAEHLQQCESCSELLVGYGRLSDSFSADSLGGPPESVWASIVSELGQPGERIPARRIIRRFLRARAAALGDGSDLSTLGHCGRHLVAGWHRRLASQP